MSSRLRSVRRDDQLVRLDVRNAATGELLMVGYMNEDTLSRTLELGQAVFWSRSRQEIWHKGATSGDYARITEIRTDCDGDALLLQVELLGTGICHTGAHSCFVDEDDVTPRYVQA